MSRLNNDEFTKKSTKNLIQSTKNWQALKIILVSY